MGVAVSIRHLQTNGRRINRKGKEISHPVACKPPPGILRIVVDIPPWSLSGNDDGRREEAEGGTKGLAVEIESFERNHGFGEVAATQPFAAARKQTGEVEEGPAKIISYRRHRLHQTHAART
jgi:hypothetical protein